MAEIEIGLLARTCLGRRIGSVAEFQKEVAAPNIRSLIMSELSHDDRRKKSYFGDFETLTINDGMSLWKNRI